MPIVGDIRVGKDQLITGEDKFYYNLVKDLPCAVYTCDARGYITFFNRAAVELWGREPVLGKELWCGSWKIFRPDGSPLSLDECPMARTLKEGKAVRDEEIIVAMPDGKRRNILPHPFPIFDSFGKLIGAMNMLVDISEKKITNHALHENEKKYRLLSETLEKKIEKRTEELKNKIEELADQKERFHKMIEEVEDYAILLLSKDGIIQTWNKGAEKIKGYKDHEVIGNHFSIFYLPEDRKNGLPEKLIQEAARTGKASQEGWRMRKDSTRFWGSILITALHDSKGNVIGFSKVTRDLTQRKAAEDRMTQTMNELEYRNKDLEQFAYIASHDLQEPLRKIQTFAELLGKNLDDKAATEKNLERISASARRMSELVKGVLSYSRLANNEVQFTNVDLNKILQNIKNDFELQITQKKALIKHAHLPFITGSAVQLHQLFSNLIGNSLKFASDRPLVIDISAEFLTAEQAPQTPQLNPETGYLRLIFKDNGIGFEPEYSETIFNLFQRLNGQKAYKGNGIGLGICRKIVENHRGLITASGEQNNGAAFTVYLPSESN